MDDQKPFDDSEAKKDSTDTTADDMTLEQWQSFYMLLQASLGTFECDQPYQLLRQVQLSRLKAVEENERRAAERICVYCRAVVPAAVITDHIQNCAKHPLARALQKVGSLQIEVDHVRMFAQRLLHAQRVTYQNWRKLRDSRVWGDTAASATWSIAVNEGPAIAVDAKIDGLVTKDPLDLVAESDPKPE